jgi:hypothetical protein
MTHQRSIYTESARQDFKTWIRHKAPHLFSDAVRVVAIADIAHKQGGGGTIETLIICSTDEWSDVEHDCATLRRAIDLIGNSENEVVVDNDLIKPR